MITVLPPAGLTNGRVLSGVRVQLLPIMAAPRKLGRSAGLVACSGGSRRGRQAGSARWDALHAKMVCSDSSPFSFWISIKCNDVFARRVRKKEGAYRVLT